MKRKPYKLRMYEGVFGFYWNLRRTRGGKLLFDGGESYSTAASVRHAVKALPLDWSKVSVIDETKKGGGK
jgi:hypothetical protein